MVLDLNIFLSNIQMYQIDSIELRSHLAKSQTGFKDKGQVHSTMMVIAWMIFANLGLWAQYFKQRKLAVSIHSAFMSITMIMVWLSGFLAVGTYGFTQMSGLHIGLGITAILLVGVVEASGVLCYKIEAAPKIKPSLVALINQIHRWAGLLTIFLAILQLLTTYFSHDKGQFVAVLVISILSIGAFYFMKFKGKKRIQQSSMTKTQDMNAISLKQIRNGKELSIYKNNYFIFEDKLYDINNVIANHPGGWEVIKAIQGRQVDRYLYGTEPLQIFSGKGQMALNNHLGSSIKMAGDPIAKLYNLPPYANMFDVNSAVIQEIFKPCKNKSMYAVYLASKANPFLFKGYTSLGQIGKYFAVNIKKNITRLYSCMNCLHLSNLQLMAKLAGGSFWENKKVIFYNNQVQEVQTKQGVIDLNLVPLYIKKYDNGAFTKQFLSGRYAGEVKVSAPRGRGMYLDELPPGQILMFAGGTGLNPFADVVDVLFKEILISQGHPLTQQIVRQCPIASQKFLSSTFQFVLFISVKQTTEIHPLTLYQCNLLAQRNRLKVFLKTSESNAQSSQQYPAINKVSARFDTILNQWISNSSQISQIYICGPPPFCQSIVGEFPNYNLEPYKYKVM